MLYSSGFKDPERYEGYDVIERLYGSDHDAIEQYAESYYEAEKVRILESSPAWKKLHKNNHKWKADEEIEEFLRIAETFEEKP